MPFFHSTTQKPSQNKIHTNFSKRSQKNCYPNTIIPWKHKLSRFQDGTHLLQPITDLPKPTEMLVPFGVSKFETMKTIERGIIPHLHHMRLLRRRPPVHCVSLFSHSTKKKRNRTEYQVPFDTFMVPAVKGSSALSIWKTPFIVSSPVVRLIYSILFFCRDLVGTTQNVNKRYTWKE